MNPHIQDQLNSLPKDPGVYIFRGASKKVLYVGKAVSLQNRVKSYFQNAEVLSPKTRALVAKVENIEHIKVETELEALLLEADLIKRYRPPYNINLKDDKYYKYIRIESKKLEVPDGEGGEQTKGVYVIGSTRSKKDDKAEYFGPYPEASSITIILKTLRKIFPYRDCSTQKFNRYKRARRPCLYGHIGLCHAPCQGLDRVEMNNKNVRTIIDYLRGNRKQIFAALAREMKQLAAREEFEKAAIIRDQLESYEYLTQERRDISDYIESPSLIDDTDREALDDLIKVVSDQLGVKFNNPDDHDFRIEIFDISNIQGKSAVGSMVVLTNGSPDKKEYRRFRIKSKDTPDDFSMMQEMLKRRFGRKKKGGWQLPDLIVVDGGKGQLSSAIEILNLLGVEIPIIGLAKRLEEIISYKDGDFKVIDLPDDRPAINVLKRGRDEAHRFAISYFRRLHQRRLYE